MIRGSLRGPKRTISAGVQRVITEMAKTIVIEADGRFSKTHEFLTSDGEHAYRSGKNLDAGTWDHRHYVKNGKSWKHVKEHGYDGHDSKEDAAASAKADRDDHDKRGKVDEGRNTELLDDPGVKPAPVSGITDHNEAAKALSKHHGADVRYSAKHHYHTLDAHNMPQTIGKTAREADLHIRRGQSGQNLKEAKKD